MRKAQVAALALALVALAGCKQIEEYELKHQAKARVNTVLVGVQKGGRTKEMQTAIFRWYNDSIFINDQSTAGYAMDMFDRWVADGGIDGTVTAFEVKDAVIEAAGFPPSVLVSGTINTRPFTVRVVKDKSIEWVTKPRGSSRFN
jgi:hypothetical protein